MSKLWQDIQTMEAAERLADADPESWRDYMWLVGSAHKCGDRVKLAGFVNKPPREITKITPAIRWEIWERDNFTCLMCGSRRFLQVDHVYPKSRGGPTLLENLGTLCKSCNASKGDRVSRLRCVSRG